MWPRKGLHPQDGSLLLQTLKSIVLCDYHQIELDHMNVQEGAGQNALRTDGDPIS